MLADGPVPPAGTQCGTDSDGSDGVGGGSASVGGVGPASAKPGWLRAFVAGLAEQTDAVLLPRLTFGGNGHAVHPPGLTQCQAYTRRAALRDKLAGPGWPHGKLMFRAAALSARIRVRGVHAVHSQAGGGVVHPDGSAARPTKDQQPGGWRRFDAGDSNYTAQALLRHPRIHHYQTRSVRECTAKRADVAMPWYSGSRYRLESHHVRNAAPAPRDLGATSVNECHNEHPHSPYHYHRCRHLGHRPPWQFCCGGLHRAPNQNLRHDASKHRPSP